jgi:mannose-1-phosphate guanylyltransferase
MKAIVLAGGYATRLRPISYVVPKLLFPVLGQPMIYWTLDLLRESGVNEGVLGVNYLADSLRARVGNTYKGVRIRYSSEETPLGTAGHIKLATREVRLNETFIVMNGDVIADIDLSKMLRHHEDTGAAVTDALHEVQDPSRFGVVQLDSKSRIRRFVEKPRVKEAPSRLVNAGIYVIEPEVLRMIPLGRKVSLEREIFPVLARDGRLSGFPFLRHWFDIGDLSEYQRANFALLQERSQKSLLREKRTSTADDATLRPPSFLGEGSRIDGKASVGPYALVGRNGQIKTRARVTNSILFDGVTIGEESVVSGAILASNVTVGRRVRIESGSILSPYVQINDGVKVGRKTIVHPYKEIALNIKPGTHIM